MTFGGFHGVQRGLYSTEWFAGCDRSLVLAMTDLWLN